MLAQRVGDLDVEMLARLIGDGRYNKYLVALEGRPGLEGELWTYRGAGGETDEQPRRNPPRYFGQSQPKVPAVNMPKINPSIVDRMVVPRERPYQIFNGQIANE